MGEGGVVVRLDAADREREGRQDVLGEGGGRLDRELLAELHEPHPRAAVDGRVLEQPAPLHEVRDELELELDLLPRPGHHEDAAIPLGAGPMAPGEPRLAEEFPDRRGTGGAADPGPQEELAEPGRPQVGLFPQGQETAGVVGPAGAVEQGLPLASGLGEALAALVEGLPRDPEAPAGQGHVPEALRLFEPGEPLTDPLLWGKNDCGHG
jgi:hypothetical protein